MGDFKPLLPWKDTTLCGAVVDKALEAGLAPVLVTGFQAEALGTAFGKRSDLLLVHNPDWEAGMVGSIQAGCRAALARWPGLPGLLVAPADMPELPLEAFRILAETGLARSCDEAGFVHSGSEPGPAALFAARNGKLGHPVWIPVQFMDDILSLGKGGQLRPYLLTRFWSGVEIESDAIFLDLDTREDYRANAAKG
jgi:molybdenum cofactor cytidylyltransferase